MGLDEVSILIKNTRKRTKKPRKQMSNYRDKLQQTNENNEGIERVNIVSKTMGQAADPEVSTRECTSNFEDCINLTSVFKMNFGRRMSTKPIPPNYFVCIRIKNEKIIDKVIDCHTSIINNDPKLDKAFVKPETLHVTLFAMFLRDQAHLDAINENLNSSDLASKLQSKLELTFTGLAHFRNSVVYVDLTKDDSYKKLILLQNHLVNLFENWGVNLGVKEKSFTPHMTLMKLSKSSHFHRQGIKKINNSTYNEWAVSHFGCEFIDSIYLCNIKEKQNDGFYKIQNSVELK